MIVKFKRPHRLAESWALLKAVHARWATAARASTSPPRSGRTPPVAYSGQTVLPGDGPLGPDRRRRGPGLLRRAGALHRAMHAADVAGVAGRGPAARRWPTLRDDARWVAFALPEHEDTVRVTVAALDAPRARRPAARPPSATATSCRRSCSLDGDRFAITDFDGARTGDPPPRPRDLARRAHVRRARAGRCGRRPATRRRSNAPRPRTSTATAPHDERRLLWHRAAAEVHYVAVALKKDRHEPSRAQRGLRIAQHVRRGARLSSRPVVAHVLGSIGLGGVPEVAWQLLRRLPDDRFDQRVYALRRAEGEEETRAARVARHRGARRPGLVRGRERQPRRRRAPVRLARRRRRRPRAHPLLPAEPAGPARRRPAPRPAGCASSPTTTTATTTSGPRRGPARSSASSRPRPIASSRARRRRPSTSRRASASPPSGSR